MFDNITISDLTNYAPLILYIAAGTWLLGKTWKLSLFTSKILRKTVTVQRLHIFANILVFYVVLFSIRQYVGTEDTDGIEIFVRDNFNLLVSLVLVLVCITGNIHAWRSSSYPELKEKIKHSELRNERSSKIRELESTIKDMKKDLDSKIKENYKLSNQLISEMNKNC